MYVIWILIKWIHVIEIHNYHMNSSSIFQHYISIIAWAMSGEHLSPIGSLKYLYLPNGVMMVQGSWLLLSSSNLLLHTIVKLSKNLVPRTLAKNVRDYWQHILLMSYDFVQLTWVADPAYSVVFPFESLQMDSRYWMRHNMHRLGIWINVNVYLIMWINVKSFIKHLSVLL